MSVEVSLALNVIVVWMAAQTAKIHTSLEKFSLGGNDNFFPFFSSLALQIAFVPTVSSHPH